jgi:phosphoglycolate phosphatase
MHRRFDLLVFDWDGTLMDSAAVITNAIQAACRDSGLPVPSAERARYVIGLGLGDAMAHILPGVDPARHRDVQERYREHFLRGDADTRLFPGAAETVAALHEAGFLLAVATGKSRRGLDRALKATGLAPYFHATRCADEGHSKPHPGMLLGLMRELGAGVERTLMIGDTTHDMEMARAAGVPGVGVGHGAHPRDVLLACGPLALVDDIGGLRDWLMRHAWVQDVDGGAARE